MSFNAIRENKILAKNSESTVLDEPRNSDQLICLDSCLPETLKTRIFEMVRLFLINIC